MPTGSSASVSVPNLVVGQWIPLHVVVKGVVVVIKVLTGAAHDTARFQLEVVKNSSNAAIVLEHIEDEVTEIAHVGRRGLILTKR
jgi:hypothetical protein